MLYSLLRARRIHPFKKMRIRIIQSPSVKHIDGVRVDCYALGQAYDVSESLADVFLAEEWAEPVPATPLSQSRLPPPPVPIYSK
jgi:hypothetical protein